MFIACFVVLAMALIFRNPLRKEVARNITGVRLCYHTSDSVSEFLSCLPPVFRNLDEKYTQDDEPKAESAGHIKDNYSPTQKSDFIEAPKPEPTVEKGEDITAWKPAVSLLWCAPFFSGGGYSSEAISYVSELQGLIQLAIVQHGDSFSDKFVRGLPLNLRVS
jgi:hypothetical protein